MLKFAVVIARYEDQWVFCRHKKRNTWELPGGHREAGETILAAAKRELSEETGAAEFSISPVCAYSVTGRNRVNPMGKETFGMLYAAQIKAFAGALHSEMECIRLFQNLPEQWTYPLIQPLLIEEYLKRSKDNA